MQTIRYSRIDFLLIKILVFKLLTIIQCKKTKKRSSFLNNIKKMLFSGILINDQLIYKKSRLIADVYIRYQ